MSNKNIAIKVNGVKKQFRLPHEKQDSIKGRLINFNKRGYETQDVLKNISFEVEYGDFFGIVGRNGSGKSTLLKLLAGIYAPTEGKIQVNGTLIPFIELGVGFNPELTGRENVFLNGALLGFGRKEVESMYDDIVEFAEIERFMDQKLKNYSSGMQVRLAFSIAIRAQGDILLLDEVLAVGDAAFQQKCFNYFEQLKSENKTVIFVSHDMGSVKRFCNRAIYLKDGEIIEAGSPDKIADLYARENLNDSDKHTSENEIIESGYKLKSSIQSIDEHNICIQFKYEAPTESHTYIGISLAWSGISIGEITTPPSHVLNGVGTVEYVLALDRLNPGTYSVGAGLFGAKLRNAVAIADKRINFTIEGNQDLTHGAAIKLPDNWHYNKGGENG